MYTAELAELAPATIEPIVYLYNAHPLEMIGSTHTDLFVGEMSIVELTHILAGHLESHGIPTLVEERNVDEKLSENNWEFYMSYYAAGYFIRAAIAQYPSLEFFIDLHRDGIPHKYATASIAGQSYARILFVIGIDNPLGYAENYAVANELHNMLEERRPGISRGIYFSGGSGRDGVYSQDISPRGQLIELGTVDSTVEEASRTIEVLAEVLANYLSSLGEDGNEEEYDDSESA
jgi:stage II sporulation protein P